MNDVGFRYFFYWMFSARELEERYLGPIHPVGWALPLTAEEDVSVVVAGKTVPIPIFQRDRAEVVRATKLTILVIAAIYGVSLVTFLVLLWR